MISRPQKCVAPGRMRFLAVALGLPLCIMAAAFFPWGIESGTVNHETASESIAAEASGGLQGPVFMMPGYVGTTRITVMSGHDSFRIAEYGSSMAFFYRVGAADQNPHLYLEQAGQVYTPGPLSATAHYHDAMCWLDETHLLIPSGGWYDGSDPGIDVTLYSVVNGQMEPVNSIHFGGSTHRILDMIRLRSGGALLAWWEKDSAADPSDERPVYFSYTPDGYAWQTVSSPMKCGYKSQSRGALCQHPADGSIWCFVDHDSYHTLGAFHITESSGTITLDWRNEQFTPNNDSDPLANDPENPFMAAWPDVDRNSIRLSYCRALDHRFIWYTPDGLPASGAGYTIVSKINVTDVYSSGTLRLRQVVDQYVQRTDAFAIGEQGNGELWAAGYWVNDASRSGKVSDFRVWTLPDYSLRASVDLTSEYTAGARFVYSDNRLIYNDGGLIYSLKAIAPAPVTTSTSENTTTSVNDGGGAADVTPADNSTATSGDNGGTSVDNTTAISVPGEETVSDNSTASGGASEDRTAKPNRNSGDTSRPSKNKRSILLVSLGVGNTSVFVLAGRRRQGWS